MNVSADAFDRAFLQFGIAYPRSFSDTVAIAGTRALWRSMLAAHSWIDDALFSAASDRVLWTVKGYLPDPAAFLDVCREISGKDDDTPKLPPPPRETEKAPLPPRAQWQAWFEEGKRGE